MSGMLPREDVPAIEQLPPQEAPPIPPRSARRLKRIRPKDDAISDDRFTHIGEYGANSRPTKREEGGSREPILYRRPTRPSASYRYRNPGAYRTADMDDRVDFMVTLARSLADFGGRPYDIQKLLVTLARVLEINLEIRLARRLPMTVFALITPSPHAVGLQRSEIVCGGPLDRMRQRQVLKICLRVLSEGKYELHPKASVGMLEELHIRGDNRRQMMNALMWLLGPFLTMNLEKRNQAFREATR